MKLTSFYPSDLYNVTVFALFFGFLKMGDRMVIISEESKLSNDPSYI